MTAATTHPDGASPLAPMVDATRVGSAGGQVAIGIAGVALALILILGQVSLATTKGMALHLKTARANITEGNKVMESVIERAAPSETLRKVIAGQEQTLGSTRDAMRGMNGQLRGIGKTTTELGGVVGSMRTTSGELATGVASMDRDSGRIADLLGGLPAATSRTNRQLSRINADTTAINTELGAMGGKMVKFGLPQALGAPTGSEGGG